jgi:hypothetical protein
MKIRITTEDKIIFDTTPLKECRLCNLIARAIHDDELGYYIDTMLMEWDDNIPEHLREIGICVPVGPVGLGVAE